MKESLIFSVLAALILTSCGAPDIGIIGGADGPTAIIVGEQNDVNLPESADTDDLAPPYAEQTELIETAPALPDRDFVELDGDLQFYRFDNDNAAVVWSETNAWVFDFTLDEVVDIFDHEKVLADIDIRGEGAKYFGDYTVDLEFWDNNDYELRITYTVTSKTSDASYTAYNFYALNSPVGTPRGELRGYFAESISYPGSDEPVTVYDVADREKLFVGDDNYLFDRIAALVTLDIAALEKSLYLDEGTLDAWKNVKVSEYSITREDFSEEFACELYGTMTVSESDVPNLPVGEYSIEVYDGPGRGITLTSLDSKVEPHALSDAEEWLEPWVTRFGGNYHADFDTVDLEKMGFHLICFYQSRCYIEGRTESYYSYDDFLAFCRDVFGFENAGEYISRRDVETHGGHGGTTILSEIVHCETVGDDHIITVNYFADPMETVIARTTEYVLRGESGSYVFEDVRTVYDSGYKIKAWSI